MVLPLRDDNPTQRAPIVTVLVMITCVVVFAAVQSRQSAPETAEFLYRHAAVPCEVVQGEQLSQAEFVLDRCGLGRDAPPVRLQDASGRIIEAGAAPLVDAEKNVYLSVLTSIFLHGGWMHLIGNMLYLWVFANNVEDRLGSVGFALFYVFTGAVAFAVHIAGNPDSIVPVVGASGAIAGAMGAYLVWYPRARVIGFVPPLFVLPLPAFVVLGSWFVLQFFTRPDSGVAWLAHVGGFVAGALVAAVTARRRPTPPGVSW